MTSGPYFCFFFSFWYSPSFWCKLSNRVMATFSCTALKAASTAHPESAELSIILKLMIFQETFLPKSWLKTVPWWCKRKTTSTSSWWAVKLNTPLIQWAGDYKSQWRGGQLPQSVSLHCIDNISFEEREQRTKNRSRPLQPIVKSKHLSFCKQKKRSAVHCLYN